MGSINFLAVQEVQKTLPQARQWCLGHAMQVAPMAGHEKGLPDEGRAWVATLPYLRRNTVKARPQPWQLTTCSS
jgi:hypothetical protein